MDVAWEAKAKRQLTGLDHPSRAPRRAHRTVDESGWRRTCIDTGLSQQHQADPRLSAYLMTVASIPLWFRSTIGSKVPFGCELQLKLFGGCPMAEMSKALNIVPWKTTKEDEFEWSQRIKFSEEKNEKKKRELPLRPLRLLS